MISEQLSATMEGAFDALRVPCTHGLRPMARLDRFSQQPAMEET